MVPQKEKRGRGTETEKEGERMQCFMKKDDNKTDRCRKCCNYRRKVLPPELRNTIEQIIVYVHRNEAHFTYIYVYHTNVFEADSIYKTLPQMSVHIFCLLFFSRSGAPPMTLLTAGALTDPQVSATVSHMCATDAWLGGVGRVPPKQKS